MTFQAHRPGEAGPLAEKGEAPGGFWEALQNVTDRAWLVGLCVAAAALAAGFYVSRAPRYFQATTTVLVEPVEPHVLRIEQVMQEELRSEVSVNTMVQRLRSRPLLARVLESERLDQDPGFLGVIAGAVPDQAALVSRLEGMVATSLRRMTRLVDITVTSRSPELSARIANAVAREFSGLDQAAQTAFTQKANGYLEQEAERLKARVQADEEALQKLREQAGSIGLQNSQTYYLPKLQEANVRLGQAHAEAIRLQSSYAQVCALTNRPAELLHLPVVLREPALEPLRQRAAQAEAAFAACQLRYKSKHPKFQQAAQQCEEARAALVRAAVQLPESYRLAREAALANAANIEAEVKQTEAEALRLSAREIEFRILSREVDSDRAMLKAVLDRLAETAVSAELRFEKIRLIQPAFVQRTPSSPKVLLILSAGVMAGLLGGLTLVFGLRSLDRSFQSAEQLEAELDLPVLNVIPRLKAAPAGSPRLVTDEQSHAVGAEAFRTLRTAITMLGPTTERRSLLFTSTVPEEGKTFVSINCAAAFAQQGLKTLVVDADLRRPSIEEYLAPAVEPRAGLTDYLIGQQPFAEIVQPLAGHPNLWWVAAGRRAPNPAELLFRDCLKPFLAEALAQFDRVVVDSAPVSAVSDALALAGSCQATVLVVRSHFTPRRGVQRTAQMLQQAGARLCGTVLNLDPRRWRADYGAYHYASGYGRNAGTGHQPSPQPATSSVSRRPA